MSLAEKRVGARTAVTCEQEEIGYSVHFVDPLHRLVNERRLQQWISGLDSASDFSSSSPANDTTGTTTVRLDYAFASHEADDEAREQQRVFEIVGCRALDALMEGRSTAILCYGSTGTGKTYTMFGPPGEDLVAVQHPDSRAGLVPRLADAMFRRLAEGTEATGPATRVQLPESVRIYASFLEIYNERIRDLIRRDLDVDDEEEGIRSGRTGGFTPCPRTLRVREDPLRGPFAEGLTHRRVRSLAEVLELIERGTSRRVVGTSSRNATSSRSHALFTLERDLGPDKGMVQLVLGDLAGSESVRGFDPLLYSAPLLSPMSSSPASSSSRSSSALSMHGRASQTMTRQEERHINTSLVALGSVIRALAKKSRRQQQRPGNSQTTGRRPVHIPYRDSVLTWLLKRPLGNAGYTLLLGTISPAETNATDTIETLRYLGRARKIHGRAVRPTRPVSATSSDKRSRTGRRLQVPEPVRGYATDSVGGGATMVPSMQRELRRLERVLEEERAAREALEQRVALWETQRDGSGNNATARPQSHVPESSHTGISLHGEAPTRGIDGTTEERRSPAGVVLRQSPTTTPPPRHSPIRGALEHGPIAPWRSTPRRPQSPSDDASKSALLQRVHELQTHLQVATKQNKSMQERIYQLEGQVERLRERSGQGSRRHTPLQGATSPAKTVSPLWSEITFEDQRGIVENRQRHWEQERESLLGEIAHLREQVKVHESTRVSKLGACPTLPSALSRDASPTLREPSLAESDVSSMSRDSHRGGQESLGMNGWGE